MQIQSTELMTFDDVLLQPAYSEVLPTEVSLSSHVSRNIPLSIPLLSAAMDTVTTSQMAIALAQEGGIGIIHRNLSIADQADEVAKVKRFESGVIKDPITIRPTALVRDLVHLMASKQISGVPVVDGVELVGIVTSRDIRFETNLDLRVSDVMTPKTRLVTAAKDANPSVWTKLLQDNRIEKILLTDAEGELAGLVTVKDIQKAQDFPYAAKDADQQLRVGASVGVNSDSDERVDQLVDAGADVIVIDTAHGHSKGVIDRIRIIKQRFPRLDVMAGNVATSDGAKALVDAGVDSVKVGIGPGSICTTRVVAGVGVPQISAISAVADAVADDEVPVIADGGIRYSGDIAKAIAAGANSVMLGSLLAGTDEAPGEIELYQGRTYKNYRGMGSQGAMRDHIGSRERYGQAASNESAKLVPEGVEGRVDYRGPVAPIVHQLMGGLRSAMGYTGCENVAKMRADTTFVRVTNASLIEGHVHDVSVTKEAPNYHGFTEI